ncbi:hypothetical protein L4D15_03190 [Enterovibrio norvegicus]|uniref:hypothetical protein n=1 Tax=Enterovibrio norvegicus TaxID=188144 RepID=UPI003044E188
MADQENKLFCNECACMTSHQRIDLEPLKADANSTFFHRATIVISNSIDVMLGSSYQQCDHCGSTFGYPESGGGF